MRLRTKLNRLTFIAAVSLAVLLALMVSMLIRDYAENQARAQGRTIVAMAKVGLLHAMQEGASEEEINKELRDLFSGFATIPGLIEMRVLRSESVSKQYGLDGLNDSAIEDVEKNMLEKGVTSEAIQVNRDGIKVFHYNGPLLASSQGTMNCMSCHNAGEGEVLGGLSVQIDLSRADAAINKAIFEALGLLLLVGILFAYGLRRILMPLVSIVGKITTVFDLARKGDFSQRVNYEHHDEIGEIASSTNHLMQSLDEHIGAISRDVEGLTGQAFGDHSQEPMAHMASVVHNLTSAVRFKEQIEGDRDLDEIYAHFVRLLKSQFGIDRFSLYEVEPGRANKLVLSEGVPEGYENWCQSSDKSDSDSCRSRRTVSIVNSISDPEVCSSFCGNACGVSCGKGEEQAFASLRHICLPVLNSQGDGIILQIIFNVDEAEAVEKRASLLQYYLRIAAPEIETRRLMQSLKESTMRDALTGLYNRRFLEEFTGNLESSVTRRKTSMGILMCDIDHFKLVNDTRGHATGDAVLREVADIFRDVFRASDLLIRYGGEEMVALLMDTDEPGVMETAERLRHRIEKHALRDGKDMFHVTISIGVAMYPSDHNGLAECIIQADSSLYEAKESGRNRVVRFRAKQDAQVIELSNVS